MSAGQPAPLPRLKANKAAAAPKNTIPVTANTIAGSLVSFGGVGCISIYFHSTGKRSSRGGRLSNIYGTDNACARAD
jgi:hypothetical protein